MKDTATPQEMKAFLKTEGWKNMGIKYGAQHWRSPGSGHSWPEATAYSIAQGIAKRRKAARERAALKRVGGLRPVKSQSQSRKQ